MMGRHTRTLIVMIAAVLMAVGSQPAFAYSWGPTPNKFDGQDIGGGAKDIYGIWYAADETNKHFRMDVLGEITFSDHANVYGIYIGSEASLTSFPSPQGESSVGTLYIEWNDQLFASGYGIKPGGSSFSGMSYSSGYDLDSGRTTLEWSVPSGELPDAFYYMGATQMFPLPNVKDQTELSAVPIPASAWLLGSGLLALVGIGRKRRRSSRKA